MLSHHNLLANVYQYLAPGEEATTRPGERVLCFLPLYHIYGLNVVLNPTLVTGGAVVLMPRFDVDRLCELLIREQITYLPQVPPVMNALCAAAEAGKFPTAHAVRASKSGAAPLAPELPRRFTELTGIPIRQGYGMTEASPVTHIGFIEQQLYRPDSVGRSVVDTQCRIVDEHGDQVRPGEPGELVMRGPQFMTGYWNAPEATASVLREGWYWSGDVAVVDEDGFYRIVDRRKELIKYKGFSIAPAEIEAVLLEHPAVRDCGVVGRPDDSAGELPVAFVVLRASQDPSDRIGRELCGFVGDRLTRYKQPAEVRFVDSVPRNPSGKILRKDLRSLL
jgi:long-chain acyl-CoA synthetase